MQTNNIYPTKRRKTGRGSSDDDVEPNIDDREPTEAKVEAKVEANITELYEAKIDKEIENVMTQCIYNSMVQCKSIFNEFG